MTSRRSSHRAGAGRGTKGDSSPAAVTRSKRLFSNRGGLHQDQGRRRGCPLSSASTDQPMEEGTLLVDIIGSSLTAEISQFRKLSQNVPNCGSPESNARQDNYTYPSPERATLVHDTISSSPTSQIPQFQKLPQNGPNSGCPKLYAREDYYRILDRIVHDQRMNPERKLSLVFSICSDFLGKLQIEIANSKSERHSPSNAPSVWREKETLQHFCEHQSAEHRRTKQASEDALSVLQEKYTTLEQYCEKQSAEHRRIVQTACEDPRKFIQERPISVLGKYMRQKCEEILSLKETIDKLTSNVEELQKIAHEHQRCVKSSTRQQQQLLNSFGGSYANKSATPGLLHSTLCMTKTAITRFQKGFSAAIKDDLACVVDLLQPDAFFARANHVSFAVRAAICEVFFDGFENESFNTFCGVSEFVDPDLRQAKFLEYYLRERDQKETLAEEDAQYEEFCEMKYLSLRKKFNLRCESFQKEEKHMPYLELGPQLASSFTAAIRSVWLLHKLAFSFDPPASIFRVQPGADVDQNYMEAVVNLEDNRNFVPKVGFIITPGLRLRKTVLRCEVYLSGVANQQLQS